MPAQVWDPQCPRCSAEPADRGEVVTCPRHGAVTPLWRAGEVGYAAFGDLIGEVGQAPVYLPWPMSPGWRIADFGYVAGSGSAEATFTTTVGTSDLDGPVEITLVSEEPMVGVGARCAGTTAVDPGRIADRGPHDVHVRAGGRGVPLWSVDVRDDDDLLAKAAFAGEADGRWLWLVMRPASAALLLRDEWLLADVTGFGPEALAMPFGGSRPCW